MLRGVERLRRELARISRPHKTVIRAVPGGPPVVVSLGDEMEIVYRGECRRLRILAITEWGLRAWDFDKQATRSFRFSKIGVAETPPETDAAASG